MAEVVVIPGKPVFTPRVSSAVLTMPTVSMKLVYDDSPVSALRKLPKQWMQFEKNFWEKFAAKLTTRMDDLNKQMEADVRAWEKQLEGMEEGQRAGCAAKFNQELREWIDRWLRLVETDCAQCCEDAYVATMKAIKGDIAHGRVKAVAKAVTSAAIKIGAGVLVPKVGAIQIAKAVLDRGKSLKGTYDKFKADWAALEGVAEAVARDIPPVQATMQKYLKAKAAGAGMADKLKAFMSEVDAPAKRLESDVGKLDQAIAVARQSLAAQSEQIRLMEAELRKAGGDADAAKALSAIEKEKQVRAQVARELDFALQIKGDALTVLKAFKDSKAPDFATLTKAVNEFKAKAGLEKDLGKDIGVLFEALQEIVRHR